MEPIITSTPISPDDDTVQRWVNSIPTNDLIMDVREAERTPNDNGQSLLEHNGKAMDDTIDVFELYDNAQRITTQDLMTPDSIRHSTKLQIPKNTKKRYRSDSNENRDGRSPAESVDMPAWLRAENALRMSIWNTSRGRKVLKTRYSIPDTDDELACYHLTDAKSPLFVRILCSFFNPQKVTIGGKGNTKTKCEFPILYLDLVISALTSIVKGSKSKTINLGKRGEKLKMEMINGSLHLSHIFPPHLKKYIHKNNMNPHLAPDDSHFNLPSSEIEDLIETLLEAVQFQRLTLDIASQRQKVFQTAVDDVKHYQSMTALQFGIKLFEIYYTMNLEPSERYPISIVLPEYYKMFPNVF